MTLRRLGSTALMLCGLLVIAACTSQNVSRVVHQVDITGCSVTSTQIDLNNGEYVHWNAKDVDYQIEFSSDEPTPSPFTVHGNSDQDRQMKGHRKCVHNYLTNGCWYKYTITKAGDSKPCADPIIHIVPGG
jgi:hypothetical protein